MKLVALCSPLDGEYVAPILWVCNRALRMVGRQMQDSAIYILFLKLNHWHHQLPFYVAFPEVKLEGDVKFMKIKVTCSWKHLHSESTVTVESYNARMVFGSWHLLVLSVSELLGIFLLALCTYLGVDITGFPSIQIWRWTPSASA